LPIQLAWRDLTMFNLLRNLPAAPSV
jgi:hypothetical protein